jgi:hypothetical protein
MLRQHGDTIFVAFAVAHHDLMVGNIKVFHAQATARSGAYAPEV